LYRPESISRILIKNLKKFGNPVGISNQEINSWWRGFDIKRRGNKLLFTGMMYQLSPYIAKITERLYRLENTPLETLASYSMPSSLTKLFSKPDRADLKRFNEILTNICSILLKSDVEFYYDPKLDFYSGILLYDVGLDDAFKEHAKKVAEELEKCGVRELVTVDPHTTYALKKLYPEFAGVEFEVFSYLELVDVSGAKVKRCIALHDPCYYARYLDFHDRPRELLRSAGIEVVDVRNSGKMTYCCGAPIEGLSPKLSKEIAKIRFAELKETGCEIVTMCPLCLANLKFFGDVKDIAEVLGGADDRAIY
jgi:Fe-S oxidoreductase